MIAASFLTKHLLIDYKRGEAHYMKYLTDGDWAQNNAGWQWSAGCGADAQPYFRVFNPVLQGEKWDPEGGYVRRWVPELALVPAKYLHRPWEAPDEVLRTAGVVLGRTYPRPVVHHVWARGRFLAVARDHLARVRYPSPWRRR
jgi:deoxyribodipyrimidine photo-lyase